MSIDLSQTRLLVCLLNLKLLTIKISNNHKKATNGNKKKQMTHYHFKMYSGDSGIVRRTMSEKKNFSSVQQRIIQEANNTRVLTVIRLKQMKNNQKIKVITGSS